MSGEQQEVVAVFKDSSGCSMEEVNKKASRGTLEARKTRPQQEDQATASPADSWEEGYGKVKVEEGVLGLREEGASEESQVGLWIFRALPYAAHKSRGCSYSQVRVWAGNVLFLQLVEILQ